MHLLLSKRLKNSLPHCLHLGKRHQVLHPKTRGLSSLTLYIPATGYRTDDNRIFALQVPVCETCVLDIDTHVHTRNMHTALQYKLCFLLSLEKEGLLQRHDFYILTLFKVVGSKHSALHDSFSPLLYC